MFYFQETLDGNSVALYNHPMSYPFVILWLFTAFFIFWLLFHAWRYLQARRLERELSVMAFPDSSRVFLRRIAHYNALDRQERECVERMMLRFVYTKSFEGVRLEVTQEMKSVVAFFASLMLLHKGEAWLGRLERVLVYAEDFIYDEAREHDGVVTRRPLILDGQADDETVVISWVVARNEAYEVSPSNVIIHELAHLLDVLDGEFDGVPPLPSSEAEAWKAVMARSYDALLKALKKGRVNKTALLFGENGAQDEGEFFAVASELFFMCPAQLHEEFAELFGALRQFYGCDPRRWGVEAVID